MIHKIIFGEIDSSDYGIYISGEGTFNAPERDTEVIHIPGRDGAFILDNNNFKNIEVAYRAFNFEDSYSDFEQAIEDFRNALSSLKGYQRLIDTYHPDEYRMAAFIGGLDVKPVLYNDKASEFDIVFECKPQRFLTSGETPQQISSGGSVTNPTRFDAHPLLKFNSDGTDGLIHLGDNDISVLSAILGEIPLELDVRPGTSSIAFTSNTVFVKNRTSYNAGDPITLEGAEITLHITGSVVGVSTSNANGLSATIRRKGLTSVDITLKSEPFVATAGTNSTASKTIDVTFTIPGNTTETKTLTLNYAYLAGAQQINVIWLKQTFTNYTVESVKNKGNYYATADSSVNALEDVDIYIDLDIGEAYSIDSDDVALSLNNFVNLGGELPTLPPGNTEITYSSSVENFEITPRWWKV